MEIERLWENTTKGCNPSLYIHDSKRNFNNFQQKQTDKKLQLCHDEYYKWTILALYFTHTTVICHFNTILLPSGCCLYEPTESWLDIEIHMA